LETGYPILFWLDYISPLCKRFYCCIFSSARCLKALSNRSALSGITLLSLFVYKYVADTSFTLLNCSRLDNDWVNSNKTVITIHDSERLCLCNYVVVVVFRFSHTMVRRAVPVWTWFLLLFLHWVWLLCLWDLPQWPLDIFASNDPRCGNHSCVYCLILWNKSVHITHTSYKIGITLF